MTMTNPCQESGAPIVQISQSDLRTWLKRQAVAVVRSVLKALPTGQGFSPVWEQVAEKADAACTRCSLYQMQLVQDAAGMHGERKNAHVWQHQAVHAAR